MDYTNRIPQNEENKMNTKQVKVYGKWWSPDSEEHLIVEPFVLLADYDGNPLPGYGHLVTSARPIGMEEGVNIHQTPYVVMGSGLAAIFNTGGSIHVELPVDDEHEPSADDITFAVQWMDLIEEAND